MNGASYFQLLNPLILGIFALGFWLIWHNARRLTSAWWMSATYACGAFGFLLDFTVRDAFGPFWGSYVSNPFLIGCVAMMAYATHQRYHHPYPLKTVVGAFVATFVAVTIALTAFPDTFARALAMNFGTGTMFAIAGRPFWQRRERPFEKMMLVLLAISSLQCFARPLAILLLEGPEAQSISYSDSLYALTLHLTSAVAALSIATSMFFALGQDLVRDLQRRAVTDPLTGLLNRRGLEDATAAMMVRAARAGVPLSVVIGDIDHFKAINDTYGHDAGDRVIASFARDLKRRDSDETARLGGEEFVVVCWNATADAAATLAETLRADFAARSHETNGARIEATASFGVADWHAREPFDMALKRADEALYRAKREGRDRVVRSDCTERLKLVAA